MSSRSLTNHFKSIGLLLAVLAFSVLASLPAAAQERFGAIGGTVTDTTKASVPGATINVTNKESGSIRTTVSGSDGTFRVPDLPPGRYTVTIELSGFQKANVDDVIVLLGREVSINHELQAGAVTETVNVVGDTRQVDLKIGHVAAQRDRRRARPPAEGAELPGDRPDGARREFRGDRSGLSGSRRQRRRELVRRRRRRHQQLDRRPQPAGHRLRISPGSPGEDQRHQRRVRRRARRRHRRGHQVRRQPLQRGSALLLYRQRDERRSDRAHPAQSRGQSRPCSTCRTTSRRTTGTKSAARSAARSSRIGCSSSVRVAPARAPREQLPLLERRRAGLADAEADADAGVRQGDVHDQPLVANGNVLADADAVDRLAGRLSRHRHEFHHQLGGAERAVPDPGVRGQSDQRQRRREHLPDAHRPSSPCAADTSRTTTRTPASRR